MSHGRDIGPPASAYWASAATMRRNRSASLPSGTATSIPASKTLRTYVSSAVTDLSARFNSSQSAVVIQKASGSGGSMPSMLG